MQPSPLAAGVYFGRPGRERVIGGLRLCRTTYAPLQRIPAHAHDGAYLCLAVSGDFRERSGDAERDIHAGMVVLHRPGETHADRFGPRPASCLNVALAPGWSGRATDWLAREGPVLQAPASAVGALVARLTHEFEQQDEASALALEGLTMELLASFLRDQDRREPRAPAWLGATIERLRMAEPVSLATLAGAAGVHPSTLARAFRRFQGCSIGAFRRRWRVERALAVLRASDAPLAEIAVRTGFADQSHLTRALRAAVGVSPAAYRRALRG